MQSLTCASHGDGFAGGTPGPAAPDHGSWWCQPSQLHEPSRCDKEQHTPRRMGRWDFPFSHLCWGCCLEPPRTAQSVVFPSCSTECRWHSCSLIIPASLYFVNKPRGYTMASCLETGKTGRCDIYLFVLLLVQRRAHKTLCEHL